MKLEISLRRNSWHYKLHSAILGTPRFQNLCPYFWLTIFCVIAAPFFFTYKLLKLAVFGIVVGGSYIFVAPMALIFSAVERGFEKLLDRMDNSVCRPMNRKMIETLPDEKIFDLWKSSRFYYATKLKTSPEEGFKELLSETRRIAYRYLELSDKKADKFIENVRNKDRQFLLWTELHPHWQKIVEGIVERQKAEEAAAKAYMAKREAERRAREESIKKIQLRIIAVTKFIAPFLLVVLAAAALSAAGLLVYAIVKYAIPFVAHLCVLVAHFVAAWPWHRILHITGIVLGSLVIGSIVVLTLFGLKKVNEKCTLPIGSFLRPVGRVGGKGFRRVALFLGDYLVAPVRSFFEFIVQYAKVAKKDYCPKINWED